MTNTFKVLGILGILTLSFSGSDSLTVEAGNAGKVYVCHVPPGNPGNAHTIHVGEPSLSAHLGHGDTLGQCSVSTLDPCDGTSSLTNCVQDGIYY